MMRKILEESRDHRLFRFLSEVTEILTENRFDAAAIGSCAVFANTGRLSRLTRDLDLLVPAREHPRLAEVFEEHSYESRIEPGFLRVFYGRFQVHVVPEDFMLIDPVSREPLGTVDFRPLLEAARPKTFVFPTLGAKVELRTPLPQHILAISLLRPLDMNTLGDIETLLGLSSSLAEAQAFMRLNAGYAQIFEARLSALVKLVPATLAGRIESLLDTVTRLARSGSHREAKRAGLRSDPAALGRAHR